MWSEIFLALNFIVETCSKHRYSKTSTYATRFMRIRSYAIFKSRRSVIFCCCSSLKPAKSLPEPDEIGSLIEEVVDLARQINFEVDNSEV
ncbi:hypothetical protein TNCV_2643491 [Trichonephila clavipes]|nr:hypothetical protein TNCV_2643491 [Trichonephila clavipes]